MQQRQFVVMGSWKSRSGCCRFQSLHALFLLYAKRTIDLPGALLTLGEESPLCHSHVDSHPVHFLPADADAALLMNKCTTLTTVSVLSIRWRWKLVETLVETYGGNLWWKLLIPPRHSSMPDRGRIMHGVHTITVSTGQWCRPVWPSRVAQVYSSCSKEKRFCKHHPVAPGLAPRVVVCDVFGAGLPLQHHHPQHPGQARGLDGAVVRPSWPVCVWTGLGLFCPLALAPQWTARAPPSPPRPPPSLESTTVGRCAVWSNSKRPS